MKGHVVQDASPQTQLQIVAALRADARPIRAMPSQRVVSLSPGRVFAAGTIARELGMPPEHGHRVDDVLFRLGMVDTAPDGRLIAVSACLDSVRQVYEVGSILYCAVLDGCLNNPETRRSFYTSAMDVLSALQNSAESVSTMAPKWTELLDCLESACDNDVARGLLGDVRLQMAYFIRPYLDRLDWTGGDRGLAIMCDGIRDNDPMIAVEGFQLAWRSLDAQLARLVNQKDETSPVPCRNVAPETQDRSSMQLTS